MTRNPLLIVVSGPSGTGKGTVCQELLRRSPDIITSISCTTRNMRGGDKEGVTYFFKSVDEFQTMVKDDAFLEHASFYGNYYGTPRAFVEKTLAAGRDCLLEIDPQGALQVLDKSPDAVSIYILPPSMKELRRRLVDRGTETPEAVQTRFTASRQEMGNMPRYGYAVVNDAVKNCADAIEAILCAERHAAARQMDLLATLKEELL